MNEVNKINLSKFVTEERQMGKKLPIYSTPITTYPHTANLASFLWENEKVYPWLMNCFLKVYGWRVDGEDFNMDYEDFYILDCPAILLERLNIHMIQKGWRDIISFIHDAINSGYYIYMEVERSKISAYNKGVKGIHDLFIYGYDQEQKMLYVADCFKNGKYSFAEISNTELIEAFPYNKEENINIFEFHNDIMLLKVNPDFNLEFYPTRVKESLEDYLAARPGRYTYSRVKLAYPEEIKQFYWGKDCWKIVYYHIEYCQKYNTLAPHCLRVFHLMYEIKAMMCERLSYMINNNYINEEKKYLEEFDSMKKELLECQNSILKFSVTKKENILLQIYKKLKKLEKNEFMCIQEIISSI